MDSKKQNKWTDITQQRVIDTENKQVVARGEQGERRKEIGEGDSEAQNSRCKINESWVCKYNVGNIVQN